MVGLASLVPTDAPRSGTVSRAAFNKANLAYVATIRGDNWHTAQHHSRLHGRRLEEDGIVCTNNEWGDPALGAVKILKIYMAPLQGRGESLVHGGSESNVAPKR